MLQIFLTAALSIDAFIASFAYGSNKVKIPFHSCLIISAVCTAVLAASLSLGYIIKTMHPGFCYYLYLFWNVALYWGFIKAVKG